MDRRQDLNNPFEESSAQPDLEKKFITDAIAGDRDALEALILQHQSWIFNIALKMVYHRQDAEDVTQEVLIKVITKLSSFQFKSSFRTWVYRITVNHMLNMKKRKAEQIWNSFDRYGRGIDESPDLSLPDPAELESDTDTLVEQVKLHCMNGMIMCLDRQKRIVFILGEVLKVPGKLAADLIDISYASYRQNLSRSRKKVFQFIKQRCGLLESQNSCHCKNKLKGLLANGEIKPQRLNYSSDCEYPINSLQKVKAKKMSNYLDERCRELFDSHPFEFNDDFILDLRKLISSREFKSTFQLFN